MGAPGSLKVLKSLRNRLVQFLFSTSWDQTVFWFCRKGELFCRSNILKHLFSRLSSYLSMPQELFTIWFPSIIEHKRIIQNLTHQLLPKSGLLVGHYAYCLSPSFFFLTRETVLDLYSDVSPLIRVTTPGCFRHHRNVPLPRM